MINIHFKMQYMFVCVLQSIMSLYNQRYNNQQL